MKPSDKTAITAKRLLELGGSLEGILKELSTAVEFPLESNHRKRRNLKQARMARIENYLDARSAKKRRLA